MYIICNLYLQLMNILDLIFYRTLFLRFFLVAPPASTYTCHTKDEGFEQLKCDLHNPQANIPHQCKTPKHWFDIYRSPPTPLVAWCKFKICCYGSRFYIVACNNIQCHKLHPHRQLIK